MEGDRVPIPGVSVHRLTARVDPRGSLTEIFRSSWGMVPLRQWTVFKFDAGVVRGPSVHREHCDAVVAVTGALQIGMRDVRQESATFGQTCRLTLLGAEPRLVLIPPGVMHAFYAATEPTVVIVGGTHEYDPDDDIKCRWQDVPLDLDESIVGTDESRARPLDEVIELLRRPS
jgi:dTDP-4-dehydrorhamnose 3,5-epimerase